MSNNNFNFVEVLKDYNYLPCWFKIFYVKVDRIVYCPCQIRGIEDGFVFCSSYSSKKNQNLVGLIIFNSSIKATEEMPAPELSLKRPCSRNLRKLVKAQENSPDKDHIWRYLIVSEARTKVVFKDSRYWRNVIILAVSNNFLKVEFPTGAIGSSSGIAKLDSVSHMLIE